ncbi:hypothetical protein TELCIR_01091 [Teladorsagia circumcincta]|uniref:Uncharacterized protein n=1 Tax=Teladorsagia circumcincta TaxID=45464 RepID=A0A2G9V371_TELCI|nr:hypothetical protein TELCIR_01091 [Teladorsagia circumcincta]
MSSPVSTASSFDAQFLQETFDNAIEETCRSFGLFSPFTQPREGPLETGDGVSPIVVETAPTSDSMGTALTAEQPDGMTYEGIIMDYAPRLAQVPSQYQLESLTEMYVCDFPKLYRSSKRIGDEMELDGMPIHPIHRSDYVPPASAQQSTELIAADMQRIQSEYVSEMLY